jgi:hypothetical protein
LEREASIGEKVQRRQCEGVPHLKLSGGQVAVKKHIMLLPKNKIEDAYKLKVLLFFISSKISFKKEKILIFWNLPENQRYFYRSQFRQHKRHCDSLSSIQFCTRLIHFGMRRGEYKTVPIASSLISSK